ncbi:hypothetical protein AGMMS49974_07160 [Deltaproteobacteria bacterium]|nr:hypothetical protein AGMMS49974_07160 [Deltaproteobacteria bacterium]
MLNIRRVSARALALLCLIAVTALNLQRAASCAPFADPRQTPAEIAGVIDAADAEAFERLVDVDSILNAALTLFLREAQQPEIVNELPPLLALMFSKAAALDTEGNALRTLLIHEAKAFVINGVASGAFAGRSPSGPPAHGLLAPLFADASTGRKEITDIGQPTPHNRDWIVPFVVRDVGNGESYPVIARISPVNIGFRMTGVENLPELMRRVNEERKHQEE